MNPAAVLALIGDLYVQIEALQQEGEAKQQIADELNAKVLENKPGRTEVHTRAEGTIPAFDPLSGPEEAAVQARKESEG